MPNRFPVLDQPMVIMDGVTRRFGDVAAVNNVSLQVPAGAILGVIGPSGSGKTTIIRMLTGTLESSEGRVRVLGRRRAGPQARSGQMDPRGTQSAGGPTKRTR